MPFKSSAIRYDWIMVTIHKFKVRDCFRWYGEGWKMLAGHRLRFTLVVLTAIVLNTVVALIPQAGAFLAAVVTPLMAAGLLLSTKIFVEGRRVEFVALFRPLIDARTRMRILPYVVLYAVIEAVRFFLVRDKLPMTALMALVINTFQALMIFVPYFLLLSTVPFGESISLSMLGLVRSTWAVIGCGVLTVIIFMTIAVPAFVFGLINLKAPPPSTLTWSKDFIPFLIYITVLLAVFVPAWSIAVYLAFRKIFTIDPAKDAGVAVN
jgi:hypothetical protein